MQNTASQYTVNSEFISQGITTFDCSSPCTSFHDHCFFPPDCEYHSQNGLCAPFPVSFWEWSPHLDRPLHSLLLYHTCTLPIVHQHMHSPLKVIILKRMAQILDKIFQRKSFLFCILPNIIGYLKSRGGFYSVPCVFSYLDLC